MIVKFETNLSVQQWLLGEGIIMLVLGAFLLLSVAQPVVGVGVMLASTAWFVVGGIVLYNSDTNKHCITSHDKMVVFAVGIDGMVYSPKLVG